MVSLSEWARGRVLAWLLKDDPGPGDTRKPVVPSSNDDRWRVDTWDDAQGDVPAEIVERMVQEGRDLVDDADGFIVIGWRCLDDGDEDTVPVEVGSVVWNGPLVSGEMVQLIRDHMELIELRVDSALDSSND